MATPSASAADLVRDSNEWLLARFAKDGRAPSAQHAKAVAVRDSILYLYGRTDLHRDAYQGFELSTGRLSLADSFLGRFDSS